MTGVSEQTKDADLETQGYVRSARESQLRAGLESLIRRAAITMAEMAACCQSYDEAGNLAKIRTANLSQLPSQRHLTRESCCTRLHLSSHGARS